jgi:hypothetical protein
MVISRWLGRRASSAPLTGRQGCFPPWPGSLVSQALAGRRIRPLGPRKPAALSAPHPSYKKSGALKSARRFVLFQTQRFPQPALAVRYGRLLTFTVTWAFAVTGVNGQLGQVFTNMLTVDPKEWISVAPPAGGGGKLAVKPRWLAFVR